MENQIVFELCGQIFEEQLLAAIDLDAKYNSLLAFASLLHLHRAHSVNAWPLRESGEIELRRQPETITATNLSLS
jgi:hypothetical protein